MENSKLVSEFLSLVDVENYDTIYHKDISGDKYFGMPLSGIVEAEKRLRVASEKPIAYFSMEYGLATSFYNKFSSSRPLSINNKNQEQEVFSNFRLADYFFTLDVNNIIDLPIYSGGLGVLAGDTLKTMADYKLPCLGVGMLWNTGYFRQKFWFKYGQMPEKIHWDLSTYPGLIPLKNRVKLSLQSEEIYLRLWKYYVYSYRRDYAIPLLLLDANVEPNDEKSRRLTDQLYRSDDARIRLMQRVILGMGGVGALRELGYQIDLYHLNEGHAVFAFVESSRGLSKNEQEELRKHFAFTCHTPVEAGHDRFQAQEVSRVLKKDDFEIAREFGNEGPGVINLTILSMNASSVINAVSKRHQEVMHIQFPKYKDRIRCVTNGVHAHTWISDRFMKIYEKYLSGFGDIKANPFILAKARDLRENQEFRAALWQAHQDNKTDLCNFLAKWGLERDVFTICWARRVAAYKRPSLIFQDIERLVEMSKKIGPLQIIFAGKAHPQDSLGFTYINEMLDRVDRLTKEYGHLKIIMPENYEIVLAKILVSRVDVWLNNPLPPFEASGTSGMKAILNGVLQLTTCDGWVAEAKEMNIGKIFGYQSEDGTLGNEHDLHIGDDSHKLYAALEEMVELYYKTNKKGSVDLSSAWIDMMIGCIAAGAHFNTYRMLDEYKRTVWRIA
jgi:glycogen phosphorylase